MRASLKYLAVPLFIAVFASAIYVARIHQEMVDFEVYREAAGRAMHAENLYRPEDGHYQYKYLPPFAFAMAPFAIPADAYARLVWYAGAWGLLCLFVRWSAEAVPEKRLSIKALVWIAVLFMGKSYAHEVQLGQTNVLLGVVLMGAMLAAEAGGRVAAGALVALGVFVKPYALLFVPWVWIIAGLPGLAATFVVLVVGLMLPALAYGWQGNIDQILGWYRTVTDTTAPNLLIPENVSFATTWAKWIGVGPTAARLATVTSVAALGVATFIVAKRRSVREPAYLEFGALMLLIPMLSPQGWDYVFLIATPAVLIVGDRWREMTWPWRAIAAVALFGLGFTFFDAMRRTLFVWAMSISFITICAMLLFACLVNLRLRRLA